MKQRTLLIASAAILLLVFIVGTLVYRSEKSDEALRAANRNNALLVRMHSPTLGRPEAKVHIVEFLDPACETCKSFYPYVKRMLAANPDRIRLSVRYAPFHKGSDYVVKVLEAARKQGKFWETLEALFASQESWAPHHAPQPQRVWAFLGGTGLNLEKVRWDMEAPEIDAVIAQDLADARALNVTKTPEFFVNGRPMPSFGYDQLRDLVASALAEAYR